MVQGIKFLSKKAFNPQNFSNRKRVWEAEQRSEEQARKAAERQKQLDRERDNDEIIRSRGETPKVSFLYDVPPGMQKDNKKNDQDGDVKPTASLTERQPGDDEAAAAFRRLLAGALPASDDRSSQQKQDGQNQGSFGVVLQGSTYDKFEEEQVPKKDGDTPQSTLEKAVGRRKAGAAVSLEEQIQRFPVLAQAPRARGMTATDVGVTFKPLGTQIRNVKCLACGVWGHQKGDRECRVSGWDPFSGSRPTTTSDAAATSVNKKRHRRHDEEESSDDSYERRNSRKKHRRRHDGDSSSEDSRNRRKKKHKKKHSKKKHRSEDRK